VFDDLRQGDGRHHHRKAKPQYSSEEDQVSALILENFKQQA